MFESSTMHRPLRTTVKSVGCYANASPYTVTHGPSSAKAEDGVHLVLRYSVLALHMPSQIGKAAEELATDRTVGESLVCQFVLV